MFSSYKSSPTNVNICRRTTHFSLLVSLLSADNCFVKDLKDKTQIIYFDELDKISDKVKEQQEKQDQVAQPLINNIPESGAFGTLEPISESSQIANAQDNSQGGSESPKKLRQMAANEPIEEEKEEHKGDNTDYEENDHVPPLANILFNQVNPHENPSSLVIS